MIRCEYRYRRTQSKNILEFLKHFSSRPIHKLFFGPPCILKKKFQYLSFSLYLSTSASLSDNEYIYYIFIYLLYLSFFYISILYKFLHSSCLCNMYLSFFSLSYLSSISLYNYLCLSILYSLSQFLYIFI